MVEQNSKNQNQTEFYTDDEIEAVTAIEFAVLLREGRYKDSRLRACDARRKRLLAQCRYYRNGNCTIDNNRPCRGKCTDDDKKIVNDKIVRVGRGR